jgi:hypothetical protein
VLSSSGNYVTEIVDGIPRPVQSSLSLGLEGQDPQQPDVQGGQRTKELAADHVAEVNARTTPVNDFDRR